MKKGFMMAVAVIGVLGVFLLGIAAGTQGSKREGASSAPSLPRLQTAGAAPISGIGCDVTEGTALHIHAQLQVYFNGLFVPVPSGLGVMRDCTYWLHTHTADGVIHVESPVVRTFTLGQFIDVAGFPRFGPGTAVRAFVDTQDGKGFREFRGSYRDIPLTPHEVIALGVGEFTPRPFAFAPDL